MLQLTATLRLGVPAAQLEHLDHVLAQFVAYCTVTQSISQSIPFTLQVFDSTGMQLRQDPLTHQETP